ncbi:MAG: UDP-3-O-(3-hydroxymyristoyl)glucosamine N-acyltransferase [Rickettsiales bacterium]|jgi:UDP-3-O-[3-hydroxymyristoyl] glucosamine N-acyltransferase|nr:UDP-3-O-(3-hydroxymyristoyl)glucosamine N-acyltransferase [Rickettsiales bacterium]
MADSRFFHNNGSISLRKIIELTGASLQIETDQDTIIEDVAPLESANHKQLSFLTNSKYLSSFKESKAGFCFVYEKFVNHAPSSMVTLKHSNPYKAYAIVANEFYAEKEIKGKISDTAVISKKAQLGDNCSIGNFVVIEDGVVIGNNSSIDHNSVIKRNVVIGNNTKIASNVTISHSVIGNNVIIHPGTRIGQDGFGFASDHTGHLKVPQLGIVKIGDFVEIGANTTIDRGSAQDTIIGDMCQIDNLVQLGHNVQLGKACVIVAQVGIAGSTKLGDFVILGGQVGVAGHLKIGNQVQVAAQSGIAQNIEDKQIMGGSPAVPIRQWHKQTFCLKKLANKDKS